MCRTRGREYSIVVQSHRIILLLLLIVYCSCPFVCQTTTVSQCAAFCAANYPVNPTHNTRTHHGAHSMMMPFWGRHYYSQGIHTISSTLSLFAGEQNTQIQCLSRCRVRVVRYANWRRSLNAQYKTMSTPSFLICCSKSTV